MSQVKVEFSGGVVAEPELKTVGSIQVLEFPVYVNDQKKDESGNYVNTGDVTKIRVGLWREAADEDIRKGDIVRVVGTLVEKEWVKQDGSTGRALQTKYVDEISVVYRKDEGAAQPASSGRKGF